MRWPSALRAVLRRFGRIDGEAPGDWPGPADDMRRVGRFGVRIVKPRRWSAPVVRREGLAITPPRGGRSDDGSFAGIFVDASTTLEEDAVETAVDRFIAAYARRSGTSLRDAMTRATQPLLRLATPTRVAAAGIAVTPSGLEWMLCGFMPLYLHRGRTLRRLRQSASHLPLQSEDEVLVCSPGIAMSADDADVELALHFAVLRIGITERSIRHSDPGRR